MSTKAVGGNGGERNAAERGSQPVTQRQHVKPNPRLEDDGWNAPTPETWDGGSTGAADDDWHAPPPRYPSEPRPMSQETWRGDTLVDAEPRKNQSPSDNLSKGASPLQNCCSRSASHYNCSSCSSYSTGVPHPALPRLGVDSTQEPHWADFTVFTAAIELHRCRRRGMPCLAGWRRG